MIEPVHLEEVQKTMNKFLKMCEEKRVVPKLVNYKKFRTDNNLKGSVSLMQKRYDGFVKVRDDLIKNNNYDVLKTKFQTDIKDVNIALKKAVEIFGKNISMKEYKTLRGKDFFVTSYLVYKFYGKWEDAIFEVTGYKKNYPNKPTGEEKEWDFCEVCRYYDDCKYNYNLEECEHYEG